MVSNVKKYSVPATKNSANGFRAITKIHSSRLTDRAKPDEMLGASRSSQPARIQLASEDELWLRQALQPRLPIF